ncbi:hypothetical protein LB523_15190 [Mesorhizobium sp. ESP-6-4]|uniref:hypothetical protein n=1 Tax=Mesorhizobium sp. ESP-6-4 TaxID=2876624 RepID=UPI001CC9C3EB|nr:hypothetical protein [Mesorhizobium sp. ESP-6-4]MBZ9660396.1 hypothetical protein [Mesorhizobium sp. ESP-6-4]
MEQLFYGLAATWVGTTGWLAYKHHKQFPPIAILLIVVSLLAGTALLAYTTGIQTGAYAVALADIKAAQVPFNVDTRAIVDGLNGNLSTIAGCLFFYAGFILILLGLPQLLDLRETDTKNAKE